MAYAIELHPRRCRCGEPATKRVHVSEHDVLGEYCDICAAQELRRLNVGQAWRASLNRPDKPNRRRYQP